MVLDRHQGQPDSCQRSHFARPQPGRVHHVLGDDGALLRHHLPGAVAARIGLQHRAVAHDLRATITRALRERMGDAARVDVPAVRVVQHALHAGRIEDRYERPGFRLVEPPRREAHPARLRAEQLELLHAPPGACEHRSAHVMEAARLAGLRFELRIELERVLVQPGHRRARRERAGSARRVPGRPRRQLAAFDEQAVGPARARQVVEHAATGDAAADDDDSRMGPHAAVTRTPARTLSGARMTTVFPSGRIARSL